MILVIGSGVSSLAFAECCRQENREFIVLEKSHTVGGKAKTYRSSCGHAWFDIAGHFLHYAGECPKIANIEFKLPIRTRNAKVLFDGDIVDYPIQQAIKERGLPLGPVAKWDDYPDNSMTSFFVERFGELAWHFFIPYNRKLWAVSTDTLQQDAYEKFRSPSKGAGYNDKFMYGDTGAFKVVETLGKNLSDQKFIHMGVRVKELDPVTQIAIIQNVGSDGAIGRVRFSHVIAPMPLPDLCEMTEGFEGLGSKLRWSSVIIFNICYKKKTDKFDDISWLYVATHKHRFFRCGWYSHVSAAMADPGYESMYVEVSYPGELDRMISWKDVQSEVVSDLLDIGVIDSIGAISSVDHIIVEKAYPLSVNKKSERVEKIKVALESNNIYPVGRYGLWRWTGMMADMKYAEDLYGHLFHGGEMPKTYEV